MADNLTTDDIIDVNDVGESEITGTEKIVALTAEGEVTTVSTSSVITANKGELETEKTARANADTALEGKITTEVTRATTAENNLSTSISTAETNAKNLANATGTLAIAHGGTGVTTQAEINKAFIGNLEVGNSDVTDGTEFVSSTTSNNGFSDPSDLNKPYKRKFIKVWNYIKDKISSVLGLTSEKVSSYDSHLTNKNNPHSVTKSQVGLGSVVNTGDSATPTSGGTTKFTTGGAYTLKQSIDKNTRAIATLNGTGTGSVTKAVSDGIAKVVANAPASFDTLKEISDWIDTHEDGASSMNSAIQANTNDITDIRSRVPVNDGNDKRVLMCRELWIAHRPHQGNNEAEFLRKIEGAGLHFYSTDGKDGCIGVNPIARGANRGTCAFIDADQILLGAYENGGNESKDLKTVVAKSYKVCKNSPSDPNIPTFLSNSELTDKHKKILRKIFGAICIGKCLSLNLGVNYTPKQGPGIYNLYQPLTIIGGQDWDFHNVTINKDGVTFDKVVDISNNYSYLGGITDGGDFYSVDAYQLVTDIIKNDFSGVSLIKVFATIMENWV